MTHRSGLCMPCVYVCVEAMYVCVGAVCHGGGVR